MKETSPIWLGVVALIVLFGLFYLYRKFSAKDRRNKMPPEDLALEEKWLT